MKYQSILCTLLAMTSAHASTIIAELNVGPTTSYYMNVLGAMHSGAIGKENLVNMSRSLAVGWSNTMDEDIESSNSLAVGSLNYLTGSSAIVCGQGNQVMNGSSITTGAYNINTEYNSLILGEGNITGYDRHRNGILLGAFNAPISKASHLVIGNGTSSNRKNSFIIYADGDIVITKPQGDISMGIYE